MGYNKVVFVCDYAANYAGNFIASIYALATKLKSQNKQVLFIFPSAAEAKTRHWEINLSQFQIAYCDLYSEALTHTVRSFVSQSDRAIIHLHFMRAFSLPVSLKHFMRNRGLFVVHEHMIMGSSFKQVIKRILKGLLLRTLGPRNAVYIGVSPAVYQQLCQEVGKKKSRLVSNAIDLKRLNPRTTHLNNNILIYGTHFERKGVDLAVEALLRSPLSAKVWLQIVTHNIKEAQDKISDEFGTIPSFISVIPPSVDAGSLYDQCFLFLSPSRLEAFGYAVVEAAYSGDQVIASDVPGQDTLKEIPGITWIAPENADQLRIAIKNAYDLHTRGTSNNVREAQEYIRGHYSLEKWVENVLAVYDQS